MAECNGSFFRGHCTKSHLLVSEHRRYAFADHYCPAPSRGKNNKYIERNAKRTKLIVADLKFFSFFGLILRQFPVTEDQHEPGTNGFQPDLAIHFLRRFLHLCATPRWQQKHSTVLMLGTVSGDGFRSTDLSRKSARH